MQQALLIRLRPTGPWRYGPGQGGETRLDTLFRSDRLYSAATIALRQLGLLDERLEATVRSPIPAVTFTSLFPYQAETLFVVPPSTLWPPLPSAFAISSPAFATKIRWDAARFVPVSIVESILTGQTILADQWIADPESGCLLRRDRPNASPFRAITRSFAAVDRVTRQGAHAEVYAGIEFESGSGLWAIAKFADGGAEATWKDRVKSAFRLLGDTGFGGRRTSGWGQTEAPEFQEGTWPALPFSKLSRARTFDHDAAAPVDGSQYWLLSLYLPSSADSINWKEGQYAPVMRGGRIESSDGSGYEKKLLRMIAEGSVLATQSEPVGAVVDVAPDGFTHPVFRSGLAVALRLPEMDGLEKLGPVETPTEEGLEPRPCEESAAPDAQPATEKATEGNEPDTSKEPPSESTESKA